MENTVVAPCGFPNPGSLCYLNSLLQCLGSSQSFCEFLMNPGKSNHDDEIVLTLRQLLSPKQRNPSDYSAFIRALASKFQGKYINIFEQNDITEMYSLLLDHIARACGKELSTSDMSGINSILDSYPISQYYTLKKTIDKHWYTHHRKEYSDMCDIACGQHIGQVQCQHCQALHHNIEVYSTLDLHIPSSGDASLDKVLLDFFKDEQLTDWVCDKCRNHGTNNARSNANNIRSLRNWRNPKMLMITMKRFTADGEKINTRVHVPQELDLSMITLCKETRLKYKLKAVACHHGSFWGGHYIALVHLHGSWFITDDEHVASCSAEDAERYAQDGYMVVYEAM